MITDTFKNLFDWQGTMVCKVLMQHDWGQNYLDSLSWA